MELIDKIAKIKKEKNILILAHYYVSGEVQDIADYVGDSYYLSKIARSNEESTIVFCGVSFMGESAKILNYDKTILLPAKDAYCPMAEMVNKFDIMQVREEYKDLAVVSYINSTTEVKEYSDVCVTSSNAVRIIKKLKEKNIYFIPDNNLGTYLSKKIVDKNFIFNDGYCPIHNRLKKNNLLEVKEKYKDALVVSHPECLMEVLENSDFIGSTSEIIDFVTNSSNKEFIIGTETGVFHEIQKRNPDKKLYPIRSGQMCENMKKITLEKVYDVMNDYQKGTVELDIEVANRARKALEKMHELAD